MNKYVKAIKDLDIAAVGRLIESPKWLSWSEPSGRNALHYICGVPVLGDGEKAERAFEIAKLLLKTGMDINSIHRIEEKNCDYFPATPLWYAYTRGRNEKLYKHLLKKGADPANCWWAIAWFDDVAAGKLWLKHGATIDEKPSLNDLFLGSFQWKRYEFARWLLDLGADINAAGPGGMTALILAIKRKDEDSIKFLMGSGADPDKAVADGVTARKIAETKGPKRVLNLLSMT